MKVNEKMTTVKINPLAEIITRKLFGIESVPKNQIRRMVNRAVTAAVLWHDAEVLRLQARVKELEAENAQFRLIKIGPVGGKQPLTWKKRIWDHAAKVMIMGGENKE